MKGILRFSYLRPLAVLLGLFLLVASSSAAYAQASCPATKSGKKYKVKIDSAPQGAAVYIGDKSCAAVGVTPWSGSVVAGTFNVIVEAPGYEPTTKSFKVGKLRSVQELFIPLQKRPSIEIRSDADKNLIGASVSIDGQPQGTISGPMVIQTTAARHQIEIKKEGFETLTQWVDLTNNPSLVLTPTLKENAKPKYGTIVVEADVSDAEVFIDGNKHPDNTPAVISNVIEGVHVIEVKKAPGPPWRQTVTVVANQQTKVRAELAPLMNAGVGVVRVISEAPGARAFLDGTDMGPVPTDIKDIKAGEHIVQVKAPGFMTGEQKVTVAPGSSQIVKFDLNPEAAGDTGTIEVVSSVPEADVFIDGAAVGKVPVKKKLTAGEHPVVVRLAGYKTFEEKVRLEPGTELRVQADLKAVGRLRVLSTPSGAQVLINGVVMKDEGGNDRTPLTVEVEVGETVVQLSAPGFLPFSTTVMIEGGKPTTLNPELAIAGKSDSEKQAEQKGLSSFGARTLARGRSTVDFDLGYPYYLNGRITVGAGSIANRFGFDATIGIRTMGSRSELGIGGRMQLADNYPFSAGLFTNFWYGAALFDDSARNGVTFDAGLAASLTALSNVTITGRAYVQLWSDRHCPSLQDDNTFENTDPTDTCEGYRQRRITGGDPTDFTDADASEAEDLVGATGAQFFDRDNGARFVLSVIAEIAIQQRWSIYGLLEGAPLQSERALFTNMFTGTMFDSDFLLYARFGATYKF